MDKRPKFEVFASFKSMQHNHVLPNWKRIFKIYIPSKAQRWYVILLLSHIKELIKEKLLSYRVSRYALEFEKDNICLFVSLLSDYSPNKSDKEVDFFNLHFVIEADHVLLSNYVTLFRAFKKWEIKILLKQSKNLKHVRWKYQTTLCV